MRGGQSLFACGLVPCCFGNHFFLCGTMRRLFRRVVLAPLYGCAPYLLGGAVRTHPVFLKSALFTIFKCFKLGVDNARHVLYKEGSGQMPTL